MTTVATYEYDGRNYRIEKTAGGVTYDTYYSESWQPLEVRKNDDTDPLEQYAWHPYYVDGAIVRFYDSDTDGANIAEHYYCQDANYNVTAILDDSAAVVERYDYTPYGVCKVLDSDFSDDANGTSDVENTTTFTGRSLDTDAGLYYFRNRDYGAELGRFCQRDPIGYADGLNLYAYGRGRPTALVDPLGLLPPWDPNASWNIFDTLQHWGANPQQVNRFELLTSDPFEAMVQAANPAQGQVLNDLIDAPYDTILDHVNVNNQPAYGGLEFHLGIGVGVSDVICCDDKGVKKQMRFAKVCVGPAAGAGAAIGPVNLDGPRCNPENYKGWFLELGYTPGIGGGIDVGFSDAGVGVNIPNPLTLDIPNDPPIHIPLPSLPPSGTYEGGPSAGVGFIVKVTFCRYYLLDERPLGRCKLKIRHDLTIRDRTPANLWPAIASDVDAHRVMRIAEGAARY